MLCKLFIYNIEDIRFSSYWRKRRYSFLFVHEHWNVKTDSSRCARIVLWSLTLRALNILFIKSFCTLCTFWMPWATICFCITVQDRQGKKRVHVLENGSTHWDNITSSQTSFQTFSMSESKLLGALNWFFLYRWISIITMFQNRICRKKPLNCSKLDKKHLH